MRTREDTPPKAVRDREAPGSNPRPPTNVVFKSAMPEVVRSRRVTAEHNFVGNYANKAALAAVAGRSIKPPGRLGSE